jgi:hypothetical protein
LAGGRKDAGVELEESRAVIYAIPTMERTTQRSSTHGDVGKQVADRNSALTDCLNSQEIS